jgi:hypothetical protein
VSNRRVADRYGDSRRCQSRDSRTGGDEPCSQRRHQKQGPDDGERVEAEFPPNLAIRGDVQQLHRLMPEEVRPQYEDAVTKPLDTAPV